VERTHGVTPFPFWVWRRMSGETTPPGPMWGAWRSGRKTPARGPLPCWLQRISRLCWFNLSTVSCPFCASPSPSGLAGSLGEVPSLPRSFPLRGWMASCDRGDGSQPLARGGRHDTATPNAFSSCQAFPLVHLGTKSPSVRLGFWSTDHTSVRLLVGSSRRSATKRSTWPRS
jgi:hypothetical protein